MEATDFLPIVKIDEDDTYKYVQIQYNNKIYIRGRGDCKYHKNVYKTFLNELREIGLNPEGKTQVLGGGRIKFDSGKKTIFIYGYSNAYGRYEGQHEKSRELIQGAFPGYKVTWSDEGY